jgi:hypothetical protein
MNTFRYIMLSSAALALIGCASQPQPATPAPKTAIAPAKTEKPKTTATVEKPKAPAQPKAPAAPKPPPVSEFQQAIDDLKLQGAELAKYKAAVDAREKALADFNNSAAGKKLAELRVAARGNEDAAKAKELEAQIAPLGKQEWELKSTQRAAVFNTLTLAQQQQWAGYVLSNWALGKGIRKVKFTDEQKVQVRVICNRTAASFVKADTITKDPYLVSLKDVQPAVVKEITDKVLTAEQKQQLQSAPAATK